MENTYKKFTVFFNQINRTNYQVLAKDEIEARFKAKKIYKENFDIPLHDVQKGWISNEDGED